MVTFANQADSDDPLVALAAVVALRISLEQREAVLVRRARVRGASWQAVASVLGVSRQAAHKKHGGGWEDSR